MLFTLLFTGLGLALVALIVVAVLQRRVAPVLAANTGPMDRTPTGPMPPAPPSFAPAPRAQPQLTSMGVAIGVWLGLWLFVLSATIPVVIYFNSYANR